MKRILVVEDDPINATMVVDYLQSHGYDVAVAMDGDQAVEFFKSLDPDLMIVDVLLPKKNGFNVCFEVRRLESQETPILLMSAVYKDDEAREFAANDLNAGAFLPKPFKLGDLLRHVEALLEG